VTRVVGLVLSCALSVSAVACTRIDVETGSRTGRHAYTIPHTLRLGEPTEYGSLNPHLDARVGGIAALTMAWLLRSGSDDRPVPELATAVPTQGNGGISRDGRTITYHLRHDAMWSDGAPFTADDVLFSTRTVLDPHTNEATRFFFDDIARVSAPDKYRVVLNLKHPYAGAVFAYFYSGGSICILPAHVLAHLPNINTAPYNSMPVGIGPFTYARWDRGNQIVLAANPRYFRGRPKLDRIIFKLYPNFITTYGALRAHTIDLAPWYASVSDGVEKDREFFVLQRSEFGLSYFILNLRRPPFDDIAVRRAVRLAIDRKRIQQIFLAGSPATTNATYPLTETVYPMGHPMYAAMPVVPHDPVAANRILDDHGWRRGADGVRVKNGRPLEITIPVEAGWRGTDQLQEILRAELHDIGAVADTRYFASALMESPQSPVMLGNFDLNPTTFQLDAYGDLSTIFGCGGGPPDGWNRGGYCDPSLDRLLAAFNATYDEAARRKVAYHIQRTIYDDVPVISSVSDAQDWIMNTDLHGFNPNRTTPYDDFMKVDI
jgi:peptide/nickel transport system substrate-binding protein